MLNIEYCLLDISLFILYFPTFRPENRFCFLHRSAPDFYLSPRDKSGQAFQSFLGKTDAIFFIDSTLNFILFAIKSERFF